jgi:hypothetical protein
MTTVSEFSLAKLSLSLLAPLTLALTSGCASFKLKDPPPGFIEVSSSTWGGDAELRMKAPDNVGLNITSFENSRGGTLPLWSLDMVKKLAARGYTLEQQTPVESANRVEGTRFDFSYTPRGDQSAGEKFYTAVLFVTDEWQVVVQMAGDEDLAGDHAGDVERIIRDIKIRGCKAISKVCKAGQPPNLMAAASVESPSAGPKSKPNGPGPSEPSEAPEPDPKPAEELEPAEPTEPAK